MNATGNLNLNDLRASLRVELNGVRRREREGDMNEAARCELGAYRLYNAISAMLGPGVTHERIMGEGIVEK